jgi:hypothetical protein
MDWEEDQFSVMMIYVTSRIFPSSYFSALPALLQLSCTTRLVANLSIATFSPYLAFTLFPI